MYSMLYPNDGSRHLRLPSSTSHYVRIDRHKIPKIHTDYGLVQTSNSCSYRLFPTFPTCLTIRFPFPPPCTAFSCPVVFFDVAQRYYAGWTIKSLLVLFHPRSVHMQTNPFRALRTRSRYVWLTLLTHQTLLLLLRT